LISGKRFSAQRFSAQRHRGHEQDEGFRVEEEAGSWSWLAQCFALAADGSFLRFLAKRFLAQRHRGREQDEMIVVKEESQILI
jgi:hypothetical protein